MINDNDLNFEEPEFEDGFDDDEQCPVFDIMMNAAMAPKPFGLLWDIEKIEKFLKARGYKIIERFDEEADDTYKVAVKPKTKVIPEQSNLLHIFNSEVQDIILNWLLSRK